MDSKDLMTANRMMPMLTVEDVSRLLHVHANTIRRWSDSGIIRTYRVGARGDRRFKRDDITHFLSRFKVDGDDLQKTG